MSGSELWHAAEHAEPLLILSSVRPFQNRRHSACRWVSSLGAREGVTLSGSAANSDQSGTRPAKIDAVEIGSIWQSKRARASTEDAVFEGPSSYLVATMPRCFGGSRVTTRVLLHMEVAVASRQGWGCKDASRSA